jgi:hypothetical protein
VKEGAEDLTERKYQEAGENYMMRNFVICTSHHTLLG